MTLKGKAAIEYTRSSGQVVVHRLTFPLTDFRPRANQRVKQIWSLDRTSVDTITFGSGVHELVARLRYDRLPQALLDAMRNVRTGLQVTYYPDTTGHDSYDARLVPDDRDLVSIRPDADRRAFGEYEATLVLRTTSTSTFAGLLHGAKEAIKLVGGDTLERWTFSRSGTAFYSAKDGTLTSAASGVPRTHWRDDDGDGVREGPTWRLEFGQENLALHSEALGNAAWLAGGDDASVTADDATAPDGATTADKVDDANNTTLLQLRQDVTVADDSKDRTYSLYIRRGLDTSAVNLRLQYTGGTTALTYAIIFDPADGSGQVYGPGDAPTDWAVERANDDYWRAWVAGANNGTGNTTARLELFPAWATTVQNSNEASATGFVHAWGAQFEEREFPSSYAKTTTSSASRPAGRGYIDLPAAVSDPIADWSLYLRWRARYAGDGGISNANIWHLGAADTTTPRIQLFHANDTTLRVKHHNGSAALDTDVTITQPDIGDRVETVVTWDGSDGSGRVLASVAEAAAVGTDRVAHTPADDWAGTRLYPGPHPSFNAHMDVEALVLEPATLTGSDASILTHFRDMLP